MANQDSDSSDGGKVPREAVQIEAVPYVPEGMAALFADGLTIVQSAGVWQLAFTQAEIPLETWQPDVPRGC